MRAASTTTTTTKVPNAELTLKSLSLVTATETDFLTSPFLFLFPSLVLVLFLFLSPALFPFVFPFLFLVPFPFVFLFPFPSVSLFPFFALFPFLFLYFSLCLQIVFFQSSLQSFPPYQQHLTSLSEVSFLLMVTAQVKLFFSFPLTYHVVDLVTWNVCPQILNDDLFYAPCRDIRINIIRRSQSYHE